MKVITMLNEKGGVGKTTLVNVIATGLAIRGYRVLAIDADPQANLTIGLGLEPSTSFYDLIVRDAPFRQAVKLISPEVYEVPGQGVKGQLIMVPSNKETRTIAQNTENTFVVRQRLAELENYIDIVIFDTSPTPSLLHSSIYIATDFLIFPVELEYYSLAGLSNSLKRRNAFNKEKQKSQLGELAVMGIIPNKFRRNTVEHQENLKDLKDTYGDLVWPELPLRIMWSEASMVKRSIFNYAPESSAAKEGWMMIDRVQGVIQNVQP